MSDSIIDIIASYLGIPPYEVKQLSLNAHKTYKRYFIPKKKGGQRAIFHPSKQTKTLQYAFIETVLSKLPVHQASAAYIRGVKSPLLINATKHSSYPYSVRIDFKDFFPSIVPSDLIKIINDAGILSKIADEDETFISKSLFVKYPDGNIGLAIGAPSSPNISNIIMFSLDEKFTALAMSIYPESIYTRYADDIFFSSNKTGACKDFEIKIEAILKSIDSPNLKVNRKKTTFTSRGTKRVVTGLYICPDGQVSIGRRNKRYIKKLIFDYKNNSIGKKEKGYLSGYLSFILDVEPDFFNRLVLKYGAELVSRAHVGNPTKR